jgi:hypothetical protein
MILKTTGDEIMNGPITNLELGKMQHREYEARASKYWSQNVSKGEKPILSKGHKLILVLSGAGLTTLLIVRTLVF